MTTMDDADPTADASERTHLLLLDPDGSPTGLLDPDAEARRLARRLVAASEHPDQLDLIAEESTCRLGADVHSRVAAIALQLVTEMILGPVCIGLRGLGIDLQQRIQDAQHDHEHDTPKGTDG